jgi:hypothetical protein
VICAMSHTSRMPFCLWRNVVSLFFLNLKKDCIKVVSSARDLQGEFCLYLTSRGLCCGCRYAKKIPQENLQKRFFLIFELGSFVRLRKHISLSMHSLAKAESICHKILILSMNLQPNNQLFQLLVWSGTLYTNCYHVRIKTSSRG